jgi:protein-S-isoprenylcysteine O-methyltransferase Ste14
LNGFVKLLIELTQSKISKTNTFIQIKITIVMNTIFLSTKGLDARGVGPRIMQFAIPLIILAIIAKVYRFSWSGFPWKDVHFITWSGIIRTIFGATIFVSALVHFIVKFPSGTLITTGAFRLSRNPIYASWMVLLLPGLSLLLNNWLFMAAAVAMYGAFHYFIEKEELSMRDTFGKEYDEYTSKVGRIGFLPQFKKNSRGHKIVRVCLGVLLAFLALNAFGGGYYGMSGAEGVPPELLEGSPFKNYFFPSLILFTVVGGMSLTAAVGVFAKSPFAKVFSYTLVILLFGWLTTQIAIIGYVSWMQPATAAAGFIILLLTAMLPGNRKIPHSR